MARSFVGASAQYLERTSAVLTAAPLTLACWFKRSGNGMLVALGSSTTVSGYNLDLSGGLLYAEERTAGDDRFTTGIAASTSVWHHGCAVFSSETAKACYLDGGSKQTDATAGSAPTCDRTNLGCVTYSGTRSSYFSGDLAEAAIWNVALSDADAAMLALGISPLLVRPDALVEYWSVLGLFSPEIGLVGRKDLTVSGATASTHPRIWLPTGPQAIAKGAGGTAGKGRMFAVFA